MCGTDYHKEDTESTKPDEADYYVEADVDEDDDGEISNDGGDRNEYIIYGDCAEQTTNKGEQSAFLINFTTSTVMGPEKVINQVGDQ